MTTKQLLTHVREVVREEISFAMKGVVKELVTEIRSVSRGTPINEIGLTQHQVDQSYRPTGVKKTTLPKGLAKSGFADIFADIIKNRDNDEFFNDDSDLGYKDLGLDYETLNNIAIASKEIPTQQTGTPPISFNHVNAFAPQQQSVNTDVLKSFLTPDPTEESPDFIGKTLNSVRDPGARKSLMKALTRDYSSMFKK